MHHQWTIYFFICITTSQNVPINKFTRDSFQEDIIKLEIVGEVYTLTILKIVVTEYLQN